MYGFCEVLSRNCIFVIWVQISICFFCHDNIPQRSVANQTVCPANGADTGIIVDSSQGSGWVQVVMQHRLYNVMKLFSCLVKVNQHLCKIVCITIILSICILYLQFTCTFISVNCAWLVTRLKAICVCSLLAVITGK